jgi:hypothetical protein
MSPEAQQNAITIAQGELGAKLYTGAGRYAQGGGMLPGGGLQIPSISGQPGQFAPQGPNPQIAAAGINADSRLQGIREQIAAANEPKYVATITPAHYDPVTKTTIPASTVYTVQTTRGPSQAPSAPSTSGAPPGVSGLVKRAPGNYQGSSVDTSGGANPLLLNMDPTAALGGSEPLGAPRANAPPTGNSSATQLPPAAKDTDAATANKVRDDAVKNAIARAAAMPDKSAHADMVAALSSGDPRAVETKPDGSIWLHGRMHDYKVKGPG